MKVLSNMWWIFGMLACLVTFINPYIGLFGIVSFIALFTFSIFLLIIRVGIKVLDNVCNNEITKKVIKVLKIMSYVAAVMFLIAEAMSYIGVYILAQSQSKIMFPVNLLGDCMRICPVLLVLSVVFSILNSILFIVRVRRINL